MAYGHTYTFAEGLWDGVSKRYRFDQESPLITILFISDTQVMDFQVGELGLATSLLREFSDLIFGGL